MSAISPDDPGVRIATQQALIEEMREMGADLTQPADVCHSLAFPGREAAMRAGNYLRGFEFGVTVLDDDIGGEWFVFAGQEQILSARYLALTQAALEGLAHELGGRYGDWEAGIRSEGWPDCGCPWPPDSH